MLDLLSQLHSDVAIWLLGVVNICCCDLVFMSLQDSSVFNLLILSRHSLLCLDITSLHCVSLSQPRFYLFNLFLCCDIKIHVATQTYLLNLKYVTTRLVQQVSVICRNINFLVAIELLLLVLFYVSTSSSMLQESMSQQSRFYRDIDSAF